MKKSNIIIFAIAIIVSVFLLWLWFFLGFNNVDSPFDLVLSIVWWVCIAGFVLGIVKVGQKRSERLRTCYVANNAIYNAEKGTLNVGFGADQVSVIQGILEQLEYGFDIKEMPSKESTNFIYVVRTEKFKKQDSQKGPEAEPEWSGNVSLVLRPNDEPMRFEDRSQLQAILAGEYNNPSSSAPSAPLQPVGAMA